MGPYLISPSSLITDSNAEEGTGFESYQGSWQLGNSVLPSGKNNHVRMVQIVHIRLYGMQVGAVAEWSKALIPLQDHKLSVTCNRFTTTLILT